MTRTIRLFAILVGAGLHFSEPALAQSISLALPRGSQRAVISQRVGLTDVSITYHRPLVAGRTIWGGLVPYDAVWRAGANENTMVEFSDPVKVEGQPLGRGVYGLHMIPGQSTWTIIFSKNSTSWGSFSYDKAEDALRVDVKPAAADFHEALTYDFDSVTPDSVVATLKWEKLAVPIKVGVAVTDLTLASIRDQLRTVPGFTWQGYDEAANFCLEHKTNYDEALKWVDSSLQSEERFENLQTKSQILAALGKTAESAALEEKAIEKGSVLQLHTYARQQMLKGDVAGATKLFRLNAQKHHDSWIVHVGMARIYSSEGSYPAALKELRTALAAAPEAQKSQLEGLVRRLEAGQDINK